MRRTIAKTAPIARTSGPSRAGRADPAPRRRADVYQAEGFDLSHARAGGNRHRLNVDESKWKPYGVESEEPPYIAIGERAAVFNGELF